MQILESKLGKSKTQIQRARRYHLSLSLAAVVFTSVEVVAAALVVGARAIRSPKPLALASPLEDRKGDGDVVVATQRGEPGGGGRRPQRRRARRQGVR